MTVFTHRLLAGFGDTTSAVQGDFVEFSILWDGDVASMPGWSQTAQTAEFHVPGSNTNIIQLLGMGPLSRAFSVLCESRAVYADLCALLQQSHTLRVPAAMNELDIAVEADYAGDIVADIPAVVLTSLTSVQVWNDGAVSALAMFWRAGRT